MKPLVDMLSAAPLGTSRGDLVFGEFTYLSTRHLGASFLLRLTRAKPGDLT
jgi:hypothetical protein